MKKVIRKIIILLILLGLAGTGGYYGWRSWKAKQQAILEKSAKSPDKLFTVKRGDLPIGVLLPGSINTRVKHKLFLEVPLSTKLVSVVEENEKVSKGDIIARFETETLQTQIDDLKISIADGEKTLKLAREELAMLISANNADLKSAKDNLDDAISAYSKYRKLDGPKNKNQQDQAVSNAYQSLRDAETAYQTAYDNYYNPTEVAKDENEVANRKKSYEAALKSLKSARISYRNAILDRKSFKRYTQPNNYKNAKDKVLRLELTMKKEQIRTQSSLAQKKSTVANAEVNLRRKERDLEQKLYYMTKMQLVAPVDGFVTYGDPERNRWGKIDVKVGMDVHRRQTLATIPDMNTLVVDLDIPEQYRSKVNRGAEVIITPGSVQNLKMNGRLSMISPLPILLIPWDPNSRKVYKSSVDFSSTDPRIVSGISVDAEIISQILKDILYIPVEAVFEEGGKYHVYTDTPSGPVKTLVEIGLANDNYVEIKNGLKENDVVYLYRPFQQEKSE